MKKIKNKIKLIYIRTLINNLFLKFLNKINFIKFSFIKSKKALIKISTFNKFLIISITLLFSYLFYLTIPNLYEKLWVQKTLENKLSKEFQMNFDISSNIIYAILPRPHFLIKDINILENQLDDKKKIAEVKSLKIFISQSNFFKKENLVIKDILIEEANFSFMPNTFNFFSDLMNKKFSDKLIKIKNSKFFFKDKNGDAFLIAKLLNSKIYYDQKNLKNIASLNTEIFNNLFKWNFTQDPVRGIINTKIKSKKIKFFLKNTHNTRNKKFFGNTEISIARAKLIHQYEFENDNFSFSSSKSIIRNDKIKYEGIITLKPFDFLLDINLDKINLVKILNRESFFTDLLNSEILFNENLNLLISLNSTKTTNSKIFNNSLVKFNVNQGIINFDKTLIYLNKVGFLKFTESSIISNNGELTLNGLITIIIDNPKNFFRFFQTPKNNRLKLNKININFSYNLQKKELMLDNLRFNDSESNFEIKNVLNNFNIAKKSFKNIIDFKNFTNKIFFNYDG